MRIKFNQTVKHDGRVYTAGDETTVSDDLGKYFLACGWAGDGKPQEGEVTLKVQSTRHKSASTEA